MDEEPPPLLPPPPLPPPPLDGVFGVMVGITGVKVGNTSGGRCAGVRKLSQPVLAMRFAQPRSKSSLQFGQLQLVELRLPLQSSIDLSLRIFRG